MCAARASEHAKLVSHGRAGAAAAADHPAAAAPLRASLPRGRSQQHVDISPPSPRNSLGGGGGGGGGGRTRRTRERERDPFASSSVPSSPRARTRTRADAVAEPPPLRLSALDAARAATSPQIPELQYGAMARHEDFLRQVTSPLPLISVKVKRYVRLEGTRLSLSKAADGEVIWSFDIAGAHVQTYDDDRKISVWLTDSMRRRRRVIVLCAADPKQYVRWCFWLRRASRSVLEMHYGMTRLINKGAFARVVLAKDLHTGRDCAIKLIEKSNAPPSARRYMQREVQIMRLVSHTNIVKCLDIFDSRLRTRIVMEYMSGGMLSEAVARKGGLSESAARPIIQGILAGVQYLHNNGIVHRDLKPDNCLLPNAEEPYGDVKLSDFGLSNFIPAGAPYNGRLVQEESVLTSAVGSPGFVAPELFESSYGTAVDLWSVGVITYNVLTAEMPFRGNTTEDVMRAARSGVIHFASERARRLSRPAKDLISGLLCVDIDKRLTATQALQHEWLRAVDAGVGASTAPAPAPRATKSNVSKTSAAESNAIGKKLDMQLKHDEQEISAVT